MFSLSLPECYFHLVKTSSIKTSISSSERLSNVQIIFLYLKDPVNVEYPLVTQYLILALKLNW